MIQYPISTIVRKSVPKNAFYKHLELNTRLRTRFVEDVEKIVWTAKYTPSTLNVEDGTTVHEIVFFEVMVKAEDISNEIFLTIDKMMPRHVVFVLVYEDRCRLLLNYKEWADREKGTFNITSNPQPPSKNDIELKEKEATQKKRLKEVKISTRRHKIPLPHNAT